MLQKRRIECEQLPNSSSEVTLQLFKLILFNPWIEFCLWLPSGLEWLLSIPAGECQDCTFTRHPSPEAFADGIDAELDHCSMKAKARCDKLADGIVFLVTRHTQTGRQVSHESARALYQKVKEQLSAKLNQLSIRIHKTFIVFCFRHSVCFHSLFTDTASAKQVM